MALPSFCHLIGGVVPGAPPATNARPIAVKFLIRVLSLGRSETTASDFAQSMGNIYSTPLRKLKVKFKRIKPFFF